MASATLYLPPPTPECTELLIHEGPLPPVAELACHGAALELHRSHGHPGAELAGDGAVRQLTSQTPCSALYRVEVPTVTGASSQVQASGEPASNEGDDHKASAWIALRWRDADQPRPELFPVSTKDEGTTDLGRSLLAICASVASVAWRISTILRDPVTGLPRLPELQGLTSELLAAARFNAQPLSMLLIQPTDLDGVNDRFGREKGDQVLREISDRCRKNLRSCDLLGRHGGAILCAVLPDTNEALAAEVANRLKSHLRDPPYLDGELELDFCVAAGVYLARGSGCRTAVRSCASG